jgi:hypothetical protein
MSAGVNFSAAPPPTQVRGVDRIPHYNPFGSPTVFGDPIPTALQIMSLSGPEGELPNPLRGFRTSLGFAGSGVAADKPDVHIGSQTSTLLNRSSSALQVLRLRLSHERPVR